MRFGSALMGAAVREAVTGKIGRGVRSHESLGPGLAFVHFEGEASPRVIPVKDCVYLAKRYDEFLARRRSR